MNPLLAGALLLGILIFVHELGHFLVAKACGVRVLTFSLGFGPRLFGFKRGDTDYRISALPLGGYVRMYGDDPTEDVPEDERHKSFLDKPYLQKSAIALAGPVMNFLLPVLLIAGFAVGTERVPDAVVGTVFADEPAALAGIRPGDRIVRVDGEAVQTFSEVAERVEAKPGVPMTFGVQRAGSDVVEDVVVTPRPAPTPMPFDDEKIGRIGVMPGIELPVVSVVAGSPAHGAGLRDLDRVLKVDGEPVKTRGELMAILDQRRDQPLTLEVVATQAPVAPQKGAAKDADDAAKQPPAPRTVVLPPAGDPSGGAFALRELPLERVAVTEDEAPRLRPLIEKNEAATRAAVEDALARRGIESVDGIVLDVMKGTPAERALKKGDRIVAVDGKRISYAAQLESALSEDVDAVHVVGVRSGDTVRQVAFRMEETERRELAGLKVFGAMTGDAYAAGAVIEREVGVVDAAVRGVQGTWALVEETLAGFAMLLTGQVGLGQLGGPITIFNLAGVAAEQGIDVYVRMMALISVNLAILNLLPIPVLDGGHLLLFTIEAVRRRKLDLKTRERVVKVGLVLVLALMVIALGNDVLRLIF